MLTKNIIDTPNNTPSITSSIIVNTISFELSTHFLNHLSIGNEKIIPINIYGIVVTNNALSLNKSNNLV